MDGGAWQATGQEVAKSGTRLSDGAHTAHGIYETICVKLLKTVKHYRI